MKKVLFVCVGNACRSQMAEGFAREYGNSTIKAHSAGTMPASSLSRTAVLVMKEKGIDISHQRPRSLDLPTLQDFDVVISMGCGVDETCPPFFPTDVIDWGLDDPIGQPIEHYRQVRDAIEQRVLELIENVK